MNIDLETARAVVDQMFSVRVSRGTVFSRLNDGDEVLPGTLYQFSMGSTPRGQRARLQLFSGLGALGGSLWEQEVRSLRALSASDEPALPNVIEGDYDDVRDIAFVLTQAGEQTLAESGMLESLGEPSNQLLCLDRLSALLRALGRLHGRGMMHRTLWPGTIEVSFPDPEDVESMQLRLSRFEMSTLLSSVLKTSLSADESVRLMEMFAQAEGPSYLDFVAPERLAALKPEAGWDSLDDGRSDVYSLGMVAYCWFVAHGWPSPADRVPAAYNAAIVKELVDRRRQRVEQAKDVPRRLRDLINGMLHSDRQKRFTPWEAEAYLREHETSITAASNKSTQAAASPTLVSLSPQFFVETLFNWGFIEHTPNDPIGQVDLLEFIQNDLSGASMTYAPLGYAAFSDQLSNPKFTEAKYVIVGRACVYFCALYRRNPFTNSRVPQVLHIRYPLRRDISKVRQLVDRSPAVALPPLDVIVADDIGEGTPTGRASWEPLLAKIQRLNTSRKASGDVDFRTAIDWLLEVQDAQLANAQYSFVREAKEDGGVYVLRPDDASDAERRNKWALLQAVNAVRPRLPLADYLDVLSDPDTDRSPLLHIWPRRNDAALRPYLDRGTRSTVEFMHRSGTSVFVQVQPGSPDLPERGWIESSEADGSRELLQRQQHAKDELFSNPSLIGQLQKPAVIFFSRSQWAEAGNGLEGTAPQVLESLLNSWPFYALHGPPGTGKTTIAARAVAAILRDDRSHRILVSSQSHDSLDNIAQKIIETIDPSHERDFNTIRLATGRSRGRVSEWMKEFLVQEQAAKRIKKIEQEMDALLAQGDGAIPKALAARWKSESVASMLEIMDRLRRGANLIFATCGTATPRNVAVTGEADVFDWVIVEEAARAWPTELAVPLVRGMRWTLIGDHRQLPAFGRAEIERLLDECRDSVSEDLRIRTANREAFIKVFDLFAECFKQEGPTPLGSALRKPCGELTTQFRMADPIGKLVSKVFYDNKLETADSANRPHGLERPTVLKKRALVWLDTSAFHFAEARLWKNDGEARMVADLTRLIQRQLASDLTLRVLTPYKAQVRTLERLLSSYDSSLIQTVDSFQGKEADVVILSMVRTNGEKTVAKRIGYLEEDARLNVMLSRARRLLVVVGNYEHFQATPCKTWQQLCAEFKAYDAYVDASTLPEFDRAQEK